MKSTLVLLLTLASLNSYAGILGYDKKMLGDLKIVGNQKEISLDKRGDVILKDNVLSVDFDMRPIFGSGDLKITQGSKVIKLKIPKENYHNEAEFTLRDTESDLDYDLFMRRSEPKITRDIKRQEHRICVKKTPNGFNSDGSNRYKDEIGNQMVLMRYVDLDVTYTLSFAQNKRTEATIQQAFTNTRPSLIREITECD